MYVYRERRIFLCDTERDKYSPLDVIMNDRHLKHPSHVSSFKQ